MKLMKHVFARNKDEVRRLVAAGEPIDQRDRDGSTALMHAVTGKDREMVRLLLELGADPNLQDSGGWSALHFAAQAYDTEITAMIIQGGGRVDPEDNHGNTPLWRAVFESCGRMEVIEILLRAGADKHRKNKHGVSPADLAKSIANYQIKL